MGGSVVRVTQREKDSGVYDLRFSNPEDIIPSRDFIDQNRSDGKVNIVFPSVGDISIRLALGIDVHDVIHPSVTIEYPKSM